MKYVILGNGPAAIYAIQSLRQNDRDGTITLVTPEKLPAYSPCLLADYLSNQVDLQDLYFTTPNFYSEYQVETVEGEKAIKISPSAKRVFTDTDREIQYDRLLISIGADPAIPSITGVDIQNVFPMKSLQDVEQIKTVAQTIESVVIIGAGFIGLETAQALRELGKKVIVAELLNRVLPQMLDEEMTKPVKAALQNLGISIITGANVQSINGKEKVESVTINGQDFPCGMVILATGVKPRTTIAREAGIKVNHGIVVNEFMETSDPEIYAAGDIVEARDIFGKYTVLANWPNATQGGKIAGMNMTNIKIPNLGLESLNVVEIADIPVCSLGETSGDDSLTVKKGHIWKKYFLSDGRIIGMQWVGAVERAGMILSLIKKKQAVKDLIPFLQKDILNYGIFISPATLPQFRIQA